jgi:hypothetical protein
MDDFRLGKFITLTRGLTSNSGSYWESSISIAMGYGLDSWDSIPSKGKRLLCTHRFQTGSGAFPVSYLSSTRGSFTGDKAAWA